MNLAIGFFDGVHIGHRRILAGADAVLTFTNHPLSLLNPDSAPPLLMNAKERIALLATEGAKHPREVRAVRFSRKFASQSPEEFAAFLRSEFPSLERVHCGANWRFGAMGAGTPDTLRSLGIDVRVVRYARYKGARVSSTRIRSVLTEGDVKDANAMLGRPFSVEASVVRGKGVGRRLGAGTLNLAVSLPVRRGVYVVDTQFGPGVANYGVAPTMGRLAWDVPVLEVHLFDREALRDAGNRVRLRVEFLSFMRPETVFASVEALRRQIAADVAAARAFMV